MLELLLFLRIRTRQSLLIKCISFPWKIYYLLTSYQCFIKVREGDAAKPQVIYTKQLYSLLSHLATKGNFLYGDSQCNILQQLFDSQPSSKCLKSWVTNTIQCYVPSDSSFLLFWSSVCAYMIQAQCLVRRIVNIQIIAIDMCKHTHKRV